MIKPCILLIGRKAICNNLGISWDTVRKWMRLHGFPVVQQPGMPPMLSTIHLHQWQDERLHNKKGPDFPGSGPFQG